MSALDLLTVLSAPASNGGGIGAPAAANADAAEVFAGFLALQTPATAKSGPQAGLDPGADTTTDGPEGEPQVFGVPSPPFAPTPTSTDVAAGPLLAIQGQLLNSGQTPAEAPAGDLPAPGDDMGAEAGDDGHKSAASPVHANGAAPAAAAQTGAPVLDPATAPSTATANAAPAPPANGQNAPSFSAAAATPALASADPDAGLNAASATGPLTRQGGAPATSAAGPSATTPAGSAFGAPPSGAPPLVPASSPAVPDEPAGQPAASGTVMTAETTETPALQKPSSGAVEAMQAAVRGGGAVAPGEAGRMMQAQRDVPDDTGRRSDRREPFMNPLLATASETADAARPAASAQIPSAFSAILQPGGLNMAQAQAGQPGPTKIEVAPPPVDAALPQGEGEAARTLDTVASTPLSARDGLPTGLSRATIETTALMAAQIVRRLEGRSTRFEMALTPEGLGRVDVSMEIDSDGQLSARLAFDNPAAAAELRGRVDDLRRQLEASGFRMSEDALEFTDREAPRDHGADNPFDRRPGRAFAGAGQLIDDAPAPPPPSRWAALALTPEGVDMKV
ncbi:flagellar hook-length control protein FliK [Brevundimonas sp.]|uniref:flagellar hook-length control protein FliK n=1 Tax=Brevundimonas sp. TaxID=1871086 RepID=UPI003919642D